MTFDSCIFFYFCMFVLSFAEMFLLSFADKVMFVLSFADKFIFCADICKKKKKKRKKRKKQFQDTLHLLTCLCCRLLTSSCLCCHLQYFSFAIFFIGKVLKFHFPVSQFPVIKHSFGSICGSNSIKSALGPSIIVQTTALGPCISRTGALPHWESRTGALPHWS